MPFRTVLSVIGVNQSHGDLTLALDLARETEAHLSVLVISIAAPPPVGEYAAVVSESWAKEREEDMRRLQERTHAVKELVGKSGISADVEC
jgi:hypothetical protein